MAKDCVSCARSRPQRLLEGELFQAWHKNVSDFPLSVVTVKHTNSFGRKNKAHKGQWSTVTVFVATFISTNLSDSDVSVQFAVSESNLISVSYPS